MSGEEKLSQRAATQGDETIMPSVDDYMMPGLTRPIVDAFLRPRRNLTTRGVSRAKKVTITKVNTALFRDLYEQVFELREMVGRKPPANRQIHVLRRTA